MERVDNRGKTWTEEHYKELRFLFNNNIDLALIADQMGRTPSACVAKLHQLNLIVSMNNHNWHKIDPDPWCSWQSVVVLDQQFKNAWHEET